MADRTSEYIELINGLKVYFHDHRLSPGMGDLEELIMGYVAQLDGKLSKEEFDIIISRYRTVTQIQEMIDAAVGGGSSVEADIRAEVNRAQSAENALSNRITANANAISLLNSDDQTAGSVLYTVNQRIAALIAEAPASFDTLKEIADWITNHADDAAQMNSDISDLKDDMSDAQNDISILKTNGANIKFGVVNGAYGYYDSNNVFKVFKNQTDTDAAYQSGYDAGYAAGLAAAKVGTAQPENVLAGKTFTNSSNVGATGTMANRGSVTETISPGNSYTIPKGYHSGYGTVTAGPNVNTGTYKPTTRGSKIDMGEANTYRYVNTTSVPNNNADTYSATSRNAAIDMGQTNTYRYVNTTSVPNNNSGTYNATVRNDSIDMGQTNTYRYVNTTSVPFNVKLINSDKSNAMKVNGYYYNSSGTKVTVTDASVAASGNVTYTCYSDDYQFTCSY